MIRKLSTLLLLALAGGALLAGCGSSSSSSSSSSTPTASTSSTGTAGGSSSPAVAAAVAACKSGIQSASTLSASTKSKLEGICAKAANGDTDAVRKAAQELCTEVINSSPLPSGSAKEQAIAACKAKT
jgi:ABC-type phosphate transport system substrate-binding protein